MPLKKLIFLAVAWLGSLFCIHVPAFANPPAAPHINMVMPPQGIPVGGVVTITGSGFNDTAARNAVYFGGVAANVLNANTAQLIVTVPAGALYAGITVTNLTTHLSGHYGGFFLPYYDNSCYIPGSNGFKPRIDINLPDSAIGQSGPRHSAMGDMDGDGRPDLVVATYEPIEAGKSQVFVYRNTSVNGNVIFDAPVTCISGALGTNVKLADLDGDGRLDIIVACGSAVVSCIRNTTPSGGALSFAQRADLHTLTGGCPEVAVGDYDGDGRLDVAALSYTTSCVKVFRNQMSTIPAAAFPSNFFGPVGTYDSFMVGSLPGIGIPGSICSADFDDDGKEDIVTSNRGDATISILRNVSTAGTMAFDAHVELAHPGVPTEVVAADMDGDGKTEIVVADFISPTVCVYANSASPGSIDANSFTRIDVPATDSGYALNVADLDGDMRPDIIMSRWYANSISVVKNNTTAGNISSSSFTAAALYRSAAGSQPQGVCIGDIDGDMKPDVTVANFDNNTVSVFKNTATPVIGSISGTDSVCMLSSVTLHSGHCNNGAGYWSVSNGHATITGGTGAGDTAAVVTGVSAGSDTITYAVVSLFDTAYTTFVISVKALADTGIIAGPADLCVSGTTTLTETATGGAWSSSDTLVAHVDSVTGMVTGVHAGNVIIYYTNQSVSCGPMSASHPMLIHPLPDGGTISGADGTCPASAITLTASVSGGTWYNLYPAVASDAPSGTANMITGLTIGTDTILYVVTTPTCGADTAIKAIGIVAANLALPIVGDTFVCVNDSVQLSNGANGGTWTSDDLSIATVDAATGMVTGIGSGTTRISYSVTYGCGAVDTFITFTVNPLPVPAVLSGAGHVCAGAQVSLTATGTAGVWSSSNEAIATVSTAGVVTGVVAGVDTIYYTVTNSCGSAVSLITDTVLAMPAIDSIMGAMPVCPGATLTLTSSGGGLSGIWASSDTAIATINAGVVTAVASGTAIVSYTVTTVCGDMTDTAAVMVYTVPAISPVADQAVCNGSALAVIFNSSVAGTSYSWSNADTAIGLISSGVGDTVLFAAHNFTDSVISSVVTVIPQANGCTGVADTFQIAVEPTPVLSGTVNFTICDSAAFDYTPASTTTGVSYAWSRAGVAGIANPAASDTGSIHETLDNTTGLPVTVTYTYTLTINGCTNEQTVTVVVSPRAVLTSALTPPDVCSHQLFSYSPSASMPGTAITWYRAGVSGISNLAASGPDNPDEVLYDTTNSIVTVPYIFTLVNAGCSNSQAVTVRVKPKAYLTSATSSRLCSGVPFIYTATSSLAGTTYAWTRNTVTGITPAAGAGTTAAISDTLINGTFIPLNAIYIFTLTANGCNYGYNVTLTVDPLAAPAPLITTHSPAGVCANTLYQNFGTANPPADTAVQYVWTATNAEVYATGSSDQYTLVNFKYPGNAVVTVTANVRGISCYMKDTFAVAVSSSVSDMPTVLYFNNTQFVCLPGDEDAYQWGYDDEQLDSTILTGEINQDYINTAPDFTKYYWCMTTRDGCTQKTYYKVPLAVTDIDGQLPAMLLYPNPAANDITVELRHLELSDVAVDVYDMTGRKVMSGSVINNKTVLHIAHLADGAYIVNCYSKGIKLTSARFIKN